VKEHGVIFHLITWCLSFEQFSEMIQSTSNSAPGPDGIPFAVWRCCPELFREALYTMYVELLDGRQLPDEFNYSFLALTAKGNQPNDAELVARAAIDTRPLSLSNTDAKLMASALKTAGEDAVSTWACSAQRGFTKGRVLPDNVIEIETAGMIASMNPENRAALLFLDFAAAFPLIAHAFIWITLYYLKFPLNIIRAIQALYKDNRHFIRILGRTSASFCAQSGVKQGCPFSGMLFVIVCDSLIRALCKQVHLGGAVGAFADDIAVVCNRIWIMLPGLARLFKIMEQISNLKLKTSKCVLVPLWGYCDRLFKTLLKECVPAWSDMNVAKYAKYVGYSIGPGAGQRTWTEPAAKYEKRCRDVKGMGMGLLVSVRMYNQMCITVLSHVMQLYMAPTQVMNLEHKMLQILTNGPYHTFSKKSLHNLT